MFKLTFQSILQTLMWTVITGIMYPLVMTVFIQLVFPYQAGGSLIMRDGKVVGSELLAQGFQTDRYFWPRPSACSYGTGTGGFAASGASNLGPTSAQLQKNVDSNLAALRTAHKLAADAPVPADLVFQSASGLDPDISPEAARFQIARVAAARNMNVDQVTALVEKFIKPPQWGVFGMARVNVLQLNLALDAADTKKG
ncbi:MAG TPA: potassium-transporting ATPase subunit KdpC [Opitutaceae bacterium]|jgi:K+-transporting ATPase ATPase C chain|nr:potassium-transporting ATPase subunit KdpC [Opitutaceae bacterium]